MQLPFSLLIYQILAVPSSVCFNLCLALLFPCWVSFAQLCMETRSQGRKKKPWFSPNLAGRGPGLTHRQRKPSSGWLGLTICRPPGKKKCPEDVNRQYMFPEELVGNVLTIFYGLQYQTDPKQKHLTLREVRICHPVRITPKSTEKSAIHRLFIYLFWRGFVELYLLCLSSHSSKWYRGAGQNDVQSGCVHH